MTKVAGLDPSDAERAFGENFRLNFTRCGSGPYLLKWLKQVKI
jgi:hypothetical protein